MEFITFEEALDRTYGKIGTPRRDKFEADYKAEQWQSNRTPAFKCSLNCKLSMF